MHHEPTRYCTKSRTGPSKPRVYLRRRGADRHRRRRRLERATPRLRMCGGRAGRGVAGDCAGSCSRGAGRGWVGCGAGGSGSARAWRASAALRGNDRNLHLDLERVGGGLNQIGHVPQPGYRKGRYRLALDPCPYLG